ncbi:putative GABA permease [Aspergillus sclerotioniger CBS 115572]|uniref:Putative GABA permease n=1 Tax=Aspergillus sclerotioniger CBS 115572 TaxID=1450535 RepID=A0A317XAS8_9EURO|nr:putative GABA permease [Aspergillus sclerotioniger CBS 115572]PWY94742.1 putative GABA permease [Aspergillus sclerotioniger CBS 115572]
MDCNEKKIQPAAIDATLEVDRSRSHDEGETYELKKGFSSLTILSMTVILMATWEALSSTMAAGLVSGGPVSLVYGFLLAMIGALATAASLSELASMYPTAGGQYHFTAKLAPEKFQNPLSWAIGWTGTFGWISFAASAPFLAATMIQGLVVLNHETYEMERWQSTLVYWALVGLSTVINIWGSRLLSFVEGVSLLIHICAFIANIAVIWACSPTKHSADFVFTSFVNNSGWSSDGVAWSIGLLSSCYVLAGCDGAIHLGEEMNNPAVSVPYCMLGSVTINGVMGFAFLLAVLFCMGDMDAALNSSTGYPIIEVFRSATGSRAASTAMTSTIILTAWLGTIALLASAARMVWSLARDKALPGYRYLTELDTKAQAPTRSILATSTVLVLLGVVNIGSTTAFNAIISLAVLGLHVSYLVPITLILWCRLSRRHVALNYGPWRMGRFGVPINLVSVLYLGYTSIFMVFPPYQPVTAENMNYASLIFGAVLIFSAFYWFWRGRKEYTVSTIRG